LGCAGIEWINDGGVGEGKSLFKFQLVMLQYLGFFPSTFISHHFMIYRPMAKDVGALQIQGAGHMETRVLAAS